MPTDLCLEESIIFYMSLINITVSYERKRAASDFSRREVCEPVLWSVEGGARLRGTEDLSPHGGTWVWFGT